MLLLVFVFCAISLRLQADGWSCESSPAIRAVQRNLNDQLGSATFEQQLAMREAAYHRAMAVDPQNFRPVRYYLLNLHDQQPEKFAALRQQMAGEHPEKPVEVLKAVVLFTGSDTPRALQLLDGLVQREPNYASAYLQRAGTYGYSGKYVDKAKAAEALAKFYQLCPSSVDSNALGYLMRMGSDDLKQSVAQSLRLRLAASTDAYLLRGYSDIWSLEFSTTPIPEHPKERQQITADLSHLEGLKLQTTAEWLSFLKDGYKQSGASEIQVRSLEDRILREFPHSDEAAELAFDRWDEQHPKPADNATAAEWQRYMRLALAEYQELIQRFPKEHGLAYYLVEWSANVDGISNEDIVRQSESYLENIDLYEGPSAFTRQLVAATYLKHHIEPLRAFELMAQALRLSDSPRAKAMFEAKDYLKPKDIEDLVRNVAAQREYMVLLYLRACRAASHKEAAEQLKGEVEAPPTADAQSQSVYWNSRAVLAEIEGHKTDALAFYQKALFTRDEPKAQYGKIDDELLTDAKRLWRATEGTEAAFAVWSQPGETNKNTLADGRWEKPDKDLPAFELTDLQGKTWKLTALEGKKVLINVWATWCGPCQEELPRLQKLYEETKTRSDIAILTLNFDEDPGMIEPFVKKKGYTFPVLPAYTLLSNKIDVNSIPRNWLVDSNGKWLWEQIGFDSSESDWGKNILSKLDSTK